MSIDSPMPRRQRSYSFLRIFDKMIMQDLSKTLIAVLSAIVLIIVSRYFISILKLAIDGQLDKDTLFHYFCLKTIVVAVNLLPVSTFMAILMILGRMYRDYEMTAMAAAGVGVFAVYRSIFMLVMPLVFISTLLALFSAPWAEAQMKLLIKKDSETADTRGIAAGRFSEYSHGDLIVYVQKITQDKHLEGIFVQDRQHGLSVINATSGVISDLDDGRYIILKGGERVVGLPGTVNIIIEKFDEYAVRIEKKPTYIPLAQETVHTFLLWASNRTADTAELQRRLSIPLGILVLAFLAVPLAKLAPRSGIYGNIFIAFLIYFCYENIRKVAHSYIVTDKLMVWPGFAGVYVLLMVIGWVLILRLYGWRWCALQFKKMVNLK